MGLHVWIYIPYRKLSPNSSLVYNNNYHYNITHIRYNVCSIIIMVVSPSSIHLRLFQVPKGRLHQRLTHAHLRDYSKSPREDCTRGSPMHIWETIPSPPEMITAEAHPYTSERLFQVPQRWFQQRLMHVRQYCLNLRPTRLLFNCFQTSPQCVNAFVDK